MARPTSAAAMNEQGGGRAAAAAGGGVTQLEFSQAMTDFRVMFPDMDADVIEAVLRSNQGAVDATIDHLLAMSADNESERTAHQATSRTAATAAAGSGRGDNPPSYQQATQDEDLINLDGGDVGGGVATAATLSSATEPIDLLSDLGGADTMQSQGPPTTAATSQQQQQLGHSYTHPSRADEMDDSPHPGGSCLPTQQMLQERYEENLKAREQARTNPDSDSKNAQFLADERLALMMQNEEFMAELRNDRDFLSTLEAEAAAAEGYDDGLGDFGASVVDGPHSGAAAASSSSSSGGRGGRFQSYNLGKSLVMDEAIFKEKLKNMGKSSKRKFSQMASLFSRRKGAKQLLGNAPAPSNDDLLLNAEPLVCQDDSDDEKDAEETTSSSKTPTKGKYTSF